MDKKKIGNLDKTSASPFLKAYLASKGQEQNDGNIDSAFIDIDSNASGAISKFQMFDFLKSIGGLQPPEDG